MPSVRLALILSFAQRYTTIAINIISTMIIARLLTPAEVGVASIGLVIVGVAHTLRDFGINNYLVQEKDLTHDRVRTAFGVAIIIAWTLALVVYGIGDLAARFYQEPGVAQVMHVLCLNFLILPFASPITALLNRDMEFGVLYRINVSSAFIAAATSTGLAYLGHGFMSLAWGSFAGIATTVIVASLSRPDTARLLPGLNEWRRITSFGIKAISANIISQIGTSASELVIGRMLGMPAVAFYSRANGLVRMFQQSITEAITPVLVSDLAARNRTGGDLKGRYLESLSYISVLGWPFFGFVGVMAEPIILVMFGDQWTRAIPIVQILCVTGGFQVVTSPLWTVFFATGEVQKNLTYNAVIVPVSVALVIAGAFHSLEMVAVAHVFTSALAIVVSKKYLSDIIGLEYADIIKAVGKSPGVALISCIVPVGMAVFYDADSIGEHLLSLIIGSLGFGCAWLAGIFLFQHPCKDEVLNLGKSLLRRLAT